MQSKQGSESRIPILAYHSIDTSGSVISTTPEKFRSQMQYLAKDSFNVISLGEVTKCICEKRPFPPRSVAITFDDGYKNVYDVAYPLLKKFGFKATVFLVAGYCGRSNQWKGQPKGIPTLDLLDWDEIIEMANDGMEFGAHTMSHPSLSGLTFEQAAREISDSKSTIQRCLDKDVLFFAYPYGHQSQEIKRLVKDEFYSACSTELDFVTLSSDIHSLPRIEMYYFSQNKFFNWMETIFFGPYIEFRKTLRTLRTWF